MYLCCDLGGTIADWGVYDPENSKIVYRKSIPIDESGSFYNMLEDILTDFGNQHPEFRKITNSTFGIAGPINNGIVRVTNIEGWEINVITVNDILKDHGHSEFSSIINDFEALGYGVLFMLENGFNKECFTPIYGHYQSGPPRPGENRGTRSLVCGPGTGLGLAGIVEGLNKDKFPYIISSEGGHHTLAPESAEQLRFLTLSARYNDTVSYEDALSHNGLRQIYNFFREEDFSLEPNYDLKSDQIISLALNGGDRAASAAIDLFCDILANFCGNTALTFNTDNTIFLWGGVLTKMPIELLKARFRRGYADRSRLGHRVSRIPVILMTDPILPLMGCIHRSKFELKQLQES